MKTRIEVMLEGTVHGYTFCAVLSALTDLHFTLEKSGKAATVETPDNTDVQRRIRRILMRLQQAHLVGHLFEYHVN